MYARVHLLARRGTGFLRAITPALRTIATHDAFLQERRSSRLSGSVTMARSPAGEVGAQATRIEVILTVDAEQVGARLIEHSGSDDKSAHSFTQASWRSLPQITGESFQFFFVYKQRSAPAYSRAIARPGRRTTRLSNNNGVLWSRRNGAAFIFPPSDQAIDRFGRLAETWIAHSLRFHRCLAR